MRVTSWLLAVSWVSACGGGADSSSGGAASLQKSRGDASHDIAASSAVPTARWPDDPCSWIPVAEVEAVVGPLAGAPRVEDGGCLYPLPLDAETARRREMAKKLMAQAEELARRTGSKFDPPQDRRPTEPAVVVQVRLEAAAIAERGLGASKRILAGWVADTTVVGNADSIKPAGWDFTQSPIAIGLPGFLGRVGELTVSAIPQATSVSTARLAALAGAVRDRVPDGPFSPSAADVMSQDGSPAGPDPCTLLAVADAEGVLGALIVPPFRIMDNGLFPDPAGETCAYQTVHHRVLRVRPTWSDGRAEMQMVRGIGGFLSPVLADEAPEAADTLEGPWDEAASEPATGDLVFLKGDRVLRVSYGTSSTNAAGAVRLASRALERLASTSPR